MPAPTHPHPIRSASHHLASSPAISRQDVYEVGALDLLGVAKSFGFEHPPKVTLMLKPNAKEGGGDRRGGKKGGKGRGGKGASGHGFSADNPYGKRGKADGRQFSH